MVRVEYLSRAPEFLVTPLSSRLVVVVVVVVVVVLVVVVVVPLPWKWVRLMASARLVSPTVSPRGRNSGLTGDLSAHGRGAGRSTPGQNSRRRITGNWASSR